MSIQEILIDGLYEFDLIIEENNYSLHYSNAEHWHYKGERILGLEDTGNGFKIVTPLRKKNHIDYDEAQELYILLSVVKESKIEIVKSKQEI